MPPVLSYPGRRSKRPGSHCRFCDHLQSGQYHQRLRFYRPGIRAAGEICWRSEHPNRFPIPRKFTSA